MERVQSVRTLVVAFSLAVLATSCSQSPPAPAPISPAPSTGALPPSPGGSTLTGIVFEASGQERRPISDAKVYIVDLLDGPYAWLPWYELTTDRDGRFILTNAVPGRVVKLTAYEKRGGGPLFDQSDLFQARAVHATVGQGTTVEIELVRLGVQPRTLDSPVLSGVIFESTPEGLRPAADMAVLYSSNGHDGADVYTRTDAQGRYRFWNLPVTPGYLSPACTRSKTLPRDFRAITFPVDIQGDTALNATCQTVSAAGSS